MLWPLLRACGNVRTLLRSFKDFRLEYQTPDRTLGGLKTEGIKPARCGAEIAFAREECAGATEARAQRKLEDIEASSCNSSLDPDQKPSLFEVWGAVVHPKRRIVRNKIRRLSLALPAVVSRTDSLARTVPD